MVRLVIGFWVLLYLFLVFDGGWLLLILYCLCFCFGSEGVIIGGLDGFKVFIEIIMFGFGLVFEV